jgi:iron(III) transport system substrate-binding protein
LKKTHTPALGFLRFCGFVFGSVFAAGSKEAAAPASTVMEDKVSMYASITSIEPIIEAFTADTGVAAENTRLSTARFVSTVLTEFEAGKLAADVLQGPLPVLEILKEQGVIATTSPRRGETFTSGEKDGIFLFGIEFVSLIYNTELVCSGRLSQALINLTDPKWKT